MFILNKYRKNDEYSYEEKKFIKDNWKTMNCENIAKELSRSNYSVRNEAKMLGVLKCKRFTDKEINFIRINSQSMTSKEIGEKLNRSSRSIEYICMKKCISLKKYAENSHTHKLSDNDIGLIRELKKEKLKNKVIAEKFECSESNISCIINYKSRMYNTGMIGIE